jgi:hypothetical protein
MRWSSISFRSSVRTERAIRTTRSLNPPTPLCIGTLALQGPLGNRNPSQAQYTMSSA